MSDPAIRAMTRVDLADVLEIERRAFASAWSRGMVLLEVERADSVCVVIEEAGSIHGYAICSSDGADWTLLRIAVDPSRRREGLARRLLDALLAEIPSDSRMTLEVRESNSGAISFYERNGFLVCGRRRAYYPDTGEDALVMWRTEATLRGARDDVPNPEAGLQ